jgi:hypothetical protein
MDYGINTTSFHTPTILSTALSYSSSPHHISISLSNSFLFPILHICLMPSPLLSPPLPHLDTFDTLPLGRFAVWKAMRPLFQLSIVSYVFDVLLILYFFFSFCYFVLSFFFDLPSFSSFTYVGVCMGLSIIHT